MQEVFLHEPFFDYKLVEYVLRVPDNVKYPSTPKKLLTDAMGDLLPTAVTSRKKQGFTFPWKYWMRNELKGFCSQNIAAAAERGLYDPDYLIKQWKTFSQSEGNKNWMQMWLIIVLEHWMQKNKVAAV